MRGLRGFGSTDRNRKKEATRKNGKNRQESWQKATEKGVKGRKKLLIVNFVLLPSEVLDSDADFSILAVHFPSFPPFLLSSQIRYHLCSEIPVSN